MEIYGINELIQLQSEVEKQVLQHEAGCFVESSNEVVPAHLRETGFAHCLEVLLRQ